jgi:uncharacterized membrane protein YjfL (UPF0719 family)
LILANLTVGFVQLIITVIFAVVALYISLAVYSKMAHSIDAERELSQGNGAVAIVVAAIFVAIAVVVVSGVAGISMGIDKALEIGIFTGDSFFILGIAVIQLIVGIVLAVGAIYLALKVLEKLTSGVVAFEELRKGNVAIALEMAGIIIAVAVIVQSGVLGITSALA